MPDDRLYVGPIYVKKSPVHGYGVFAAQDIPADELIEECRTLVYDKKPNPLYHYSFDWQDLTALPLGFGCIYNHSATPNVRYTCDPARGVIIFKTIAPVRQDQELFSSYGKHWFDSRQLKMRKSSFWTRFYHRKGRLLLRATVITLAVYACIAGLYHFSL